MISIHEDTPTSARELNPTITVEFARTIEQLLIRKCDDRLSSAREVLACLDGSATLPETPILVETPKGRKRRLLLGLIVIVLMLNIVMVALLNRPVRPGVEPTEAEQESKREEPKQSNPIAVIVPKVEPKVEPLNRPARLSGNPTKAQIDSARVEWAKHSGVPLTFSEDLGNNVTLDMVFVPPGTYWMGSPDHEEQRGADESQHEVTINRGFCMSRYEVTQEQYEALIGSNPSFFKKGGLMAVKLKDLDTNRFPVDSVNWKQAQEFLVKLTSRSELHGRKYKYRLPTEAEWEYACRGGACSKESFPFHFELGSQNTLNSTEANFDGMAPFGGARSMPTLRRPTYVGRDKPNRFGLFDMHGNMMEWCADWYNEEYYRSSPPNDPTGPDIGVDRVLRGGYWNSKGGGCRAAYRTRKDPMTHHMSVGFRVVATIPDGE